MKDEKEILTRDSIQKKLIHEAKRAIIGPALLLLLGAFVYGIMFLALIAPSWDSKLFLIFIAVPFAILAIILIIRMIKGFAQLGKARRGEFSIVEDRLTRMEDHKFRFWRFLLRFDLRAPVMSFIRKPYYEHVFHFASGKQFVIDAYEYENTHIGTVAQFSQTGDELILVSYDDAPEKIIMLFSPKIYNYKK